MRAWYVADAAGARACFRADFDSALKTGLNIPVELVFTHHESPRSVDPRFRIRVRRCVDSESHGAQESHTHRGTSRVCGLSTTAVTAQATKVTGCYARAARGLEETSAYTWRRTRTTIVRAGPRARASLRIDAPQPLPPAPPCSGLAADVCPGAHSDGRGVQSLLWGLHPSE